ncbi:hypothetical protein ACJJTC_008266 [Scirpophaga incertulas]
MEIRNLCLYFVINCAILVPVLHAKPFSINEALAAEAKYKKLGTASSNFKDSSPHQFSLNTAKKSQILSRVKDQHPLKKLSLPRHEKPDLLQRILKPSKLKELFTPLRLYRGSSRKREINNDDKRYPILKNLGLLLDNLFNTVPDESYEIRTKQKYPARKRGILCKCAYQPDLGTKESHQKTASFTKTEPFATATFKTETVNSTVVDVVNQEQVNDISILFPRDSTGDRRNSSGHSEGSSPTFYRNFQRNIPRNIGYREYFPRNTRESGSKSHEEIAYSSPRNSSSSSKWKRKSSRKQQSIKNNFFKTESKSEETKNINTNLRGESNQYVTRKTKHKIGENETESQTFIPKHIPGLRRPISRYQEGNNTESIQSNKPSEKSDKDVTFNNTNNKQVIDGSGADTTKTERTNSDEDLISIEDLSNLKLALRKSSNKNTSAVTIIDGYSIARNKNAMKDICKSGEVMVDNNI